jgi:glycosyltransferase involved in cell wall biosynthesis
MNICLVSKEYPPETGWGGIGTYTYNLAHGLTDKGHDVLVISLALNEERKYKDKKVKVIRIKAEPIRYKLFFKILGKISPAITSRAVWSYNVKQKIKGINRAYKIDVIEAPLWDGEGFLLRLKNIPLIIRLQTPFFIAATLYKDQVKSVKASCWIERQSLLKADLIASISKSSGRMIGEYYKINPQKIIYTPLGMPYKKLKSDVKKEKKIKKVLFVGRLERRKGIKELIEAIPVVIKRYSNVEFDIVGKDSQVAPGNISYEGYAKKILKKNELKKVIFHGFCTEDALKRFYNNCDMLVAPSIYESCGQIYLEAMEFAKPVIGTDVGGIPEIVKDKETGLLVKPGDSKQLTESMISLLEDDDLRQKMGINGRKLAQEKFSVKKMVDSTLNLYKAAIKIAGGQK